MNNVNFFEEEMYHMFDASGISNDIAYIKNSISYPDFLINFIDETEWNKHNNITFKKINGSYPASSLNNKKSYIINSLYMAAEMSFDAYRSAKQIRKDAFQVDLENTTAYLVQDNESLNNLIKNVNNDILCLTILNNNISVEFEGRVTQIVEGSTIISPKEAIYTAIATAGPIYVIITPIINKSKLTDCLM